MRTKQRLLHWHRIDPACHFYSIVCFSNFRRLRILKQTNGIALVVNREKNKLLKRTRESIDAKSRVFSTVTEFVYINNDRSRTNAINSTAHSMWDLILNEFLFSVIIECHYYVAVLLICTNQFQCGTIDRHFSHHMAMALEEFTGWFWYSRDLLVASLVRGLFIIQHSNLLAAQRFLMNFLESFLAADITFSFAEITCNLMVW